MVVISANVEVTGAARLYRAASVWTAGLALAITAAHSQALPKQQDVC